jgi:hypothetical protein
MAFRLGALASVPLLVSWNVVVPFATGETVEGCRN